MIKDSFAEHSVDQNVSCLLHLHSVTGAEHVTLVDPATKSDVGKDLIGDGFLIAEKNKKDRRLQKLVS